MKEGGREGGREGETSQLVSSILDMLTEGIGSTFPSLSSDHHSQ